jgi:hypothetical protein
MRLIWSSDGRHELYDLALDPGETHNLYDPDDARALELAGILEDYQRGTNAGLPQASGGDVLPPLDEESREALRALGYVR